MSKIMNFIKNNYRYLLFCFAFIVINILFLNNTFLFSDDLNLGFKYYIILIFSIVFTIVMCIFLFKFNSKNVKIENQFLFLSIVLGIFYLLLIPVGLVPDEKSHFGRAYEIASGHLVSNVNKDGRGGNVLPVEVSDSLASDVNYTYDDLLKTIGKTNTGKKRFIVYNGASLYSFACYIPQTLGIVIGKIFSLPMLITAYLGRIFNFISFIFLIYFSIKYVPVLKKYIMFISLLPITMQEAVSLSPDSITIGFAVFMFSYIMYLAYERKDKLRRKDYIILTITSIMMAMLKIVYIPLCLLLFVIPKECFKSTKDKYIKIICLGIIVVIINLLWLKFASRYLTEFHEGVNASKQIKLILTNPIKYIQVLFNSWVTNGSFYIFTMIGKGLELFNIDLAYIYPLATLFIMSVMIYNTKFTNFIVKMKDKLIVLFVFIIVILLIFTSLYVQWTPVANEIIDGVQGRYFIPILSLLPFLFLPINKGKVKLEIEKNLYINSFIVFQSVYVLITIFCTNLL